jgi:nucleotide-binding universal stress UspA family protein
LCRSPVLACNNAFSTCFAREDRAMYERILVPVDGSDASNRGLHEAIRLAKALGGELRFVHIVDDSPLTLNPETGIAAGPLVADFAQAGRSVLEDARAVARAEGLEPSLALHENFTGRVADLIVEEARKWRAEVIVMGTHGRRGVRHAVLGSDAEAVVQRAETPVLLVRSIRPKK